jgi:hypothetical protein
MGMRADMLYDLFGSQVDGIGWDRSEVSFSREVHARRWVIDEAANVTRQFDGILEHGHL